MLALSALLALTLAANAAEVIKPQTNEPLRDVVVNRAPNASPRGKSPDFGGRARPPGAPGAARRSSPTKSEPRCRRATPLRRLRA